jgi:hypothetical protein
MYLLYVMNILDFFLSVRTYVHSLFYFFYSRSKFLTGAGRLLEKETMTIEKKKNPYIKIYCIYCYNVVLLIYFILAHLTN